MSFETENMISPPAEVSNQGCNRSDDEDKQTIETSDSEPESTSICDTDNQGMTNCLAAPKRTNIRRLSGELKETASGAIVYGVDGIKKAASGLSSGIRTVTNKIPMPKSPKALRRRSWNAYDELEDHIIDSDPPEECGNKKSDKNDKTKENKSADKAKKDKTKGKKIGGKKSPVPSKKIDWLMIYHDDVKCDKDGHLDDEEETKPRANGDTETLPSDEEEEDDVSFDSLPTAGLMSKVTINVEHMD